MGGVIVAWTDVRTGDSDIYAQRLTSNEVPLWDVNGRQVTGTPSYDVLPQIASDGAGGAIVAWKALAGTTDLYAQRIGANGTLEWPAEAAICAASGTPNNHCITADGAGGAIIGWADDRAGTFDVYAQRVGPNGQLRWTADGTPISTAARTQDFPGVVTDGAGGAIFAWNDDRNAVTTRAYAQRIERYGQLGNPEAVITSVRDTPNDQGGQVKVSWSASYLDVDPTYGVHEYRLWRSAPPGAAVARALASDRTTGDPDEAAATGRWLVLPGAATAYAWELVSSHQASTLASYSAVAPTTGDSTAVSNPRTAFMVEARSGSLADSPRWFSAPDSGYSVDNLSPAMPAPFSLVAVPGAHELRWGANAEADLAGYRLYRGVTADFVPSAVTLLSEQASAGFTDVTSYAYFYKLSAVDLHGNESAFAFLAASGTTDVEEPGLPAALRLGGPEPNPARARTRVRFDLPRGAFVSLAVYDANGRAVRKLVRGTREAGRFDTPWDLRDDTGREVPSGLYFLRLEALGRTLTRRIVAMR